MKSSGSRSIKAAKKVNPAQKTTTVASYFKALSPDTRERMEAIRAIFKKEAPGAEELMSYNMPAFKLNKVFGWYAAWKNHIAFYPRTAAMDKALPELAAYEAAKGTVKFPANEPLPLVLIRKMIRLRVKEDKQEANA